MTKKKNHNDEVASQNQEALASEAPPEQPPVDNDHVAEGCEKFSEPQKPNIEHRFKHFRGEFEERLKELTQKFHDEANSLVSDLVRKVSGDE